MLVIKFDYVVRNIKFDDIHHHVHTLEEIEEHGNLETYMFSPNGIILARRLWSGLTDMNDIEIYEGDIVQWHDPKRIFPGTEEAKPVFGTNWIAAVVFEDGAFSFDKTRTTFWNEAYNAAEIPDWDFPKHMEVIGNIYENANLLEGRGEA